MVFAMLYAHDAALSPSSAGPCRDLVHDLPLPRKERCYHLHVPHDLRDAFRGFARNPGFVMAAVLSLALGVGANTAIFSVASALLLRPLPYQDADRLVILWNRSPGLGIAEDWFSTAQYFDIKNGASRLRAGRDRVSAATTTSPATASPSGSARSASRRTCCRCSARAPLLGRLFTADEDAPDAAGDARCSATATWVRRYGGDPQRHRAADHAERTAVPDRRRPAARRSRCRARCCRRSAAPRTPRSLLPLPLAADAPRRRATARTTTSSAS